MTAYDWNGWLRTWNAMLIGAVDVDHADSFDPEVTPEVLASGWLGSPGATDGEIAALERRLGTRLPPSYRAFLKTSNGFLQPTALVPRILATDDVDWFRAQHEDVIESWSLGVKLGGAADDPNAFQHFLPTALQVSAIERDGSAVYLLNPKVVGPDGEWEAFYFAHWIPGVNRYPSFSALMEAEMSSWEPPDAPTASATANASVRTWWDALRWAIMGK